MEVPKRRKSGMAAKAAAFGVSIDDLIHPVK